MHATALPRRAGQARANRVFQPLMGIPDHQAHARQAALEQAAQKRRPKAAVFGRAHVHPQHLALALTRDADRHDGRLADDSAVDPHLVVGRVEPRMLAGNRARAPPPGRGRLRCGTLPTSRPRPVLTPLLARDFPERARDDPVRRCRAPRARRRMGGVWPAVFQRGIDGPTPRAAGVGHGAELLMAIA